MLMMPTRSIRLWLMTTMASLLFAPTAAMAVFEDAKLTASDGAADDLFGFPVSISGHSIFGGRALFGASGDDGATGSAYVFRYNGSSWVEEAKLTASDGVTADYFGGALSISGDTVVVGAYGDDDNGSLSGSAYVFRYIGSSWVEEAKLTASDAAAADLFGRSVSIVGDTALIGAPTSPSITRTGAAYVFRYNGSSWVEEAKLTASDGQVRNWFGVSATVSGDTALIGADGDNEIGGSAGAAYVFRYNGSNWVEEAKLTASDGAFTDQLGTSSSISGDTALLGAFHDDDNGPESGSAYVFRFNGSSWVEEAKLTASDVGAQRDDDNGANSGSAYVFQFTGSTWLQLAKLTASDGAAEDRFGASVSISGDSIFGDAALVGALEDDDNGLDSGSVYVFGEPAQVPALGPVGIALLLAALGATAWWMLRDSRSAA